MTTLEEKISALLVECEKLMVPMDVFVERCVIVSSTQTQTREFRDDSRSLACSFSLICREALKLESYKAAKICYERDSVFSEVRRSGGYWGNFDNIVRHLIISSSRVARGTIQIDFDKVIETLKDLNRLFSSEQIEYLATIRLFGAGLSQKSINFPDNVIAYRLNRKELNDRQPIVDSFISFGFATHELASTPVELQLLVTVTVDHGKDGALIRAGSEAEKVATGIFLKIVDSILVAKEGKTTTGHFNLNSELNFIPIGKSMDKPLSSHIHLTISKADIEKINIAYGLLSNGVRCDKVINRSLHRFVLGRKRADIFDKLIDYVVAWESILLTNNGSPITQELIYRFALNGAAIISVATKTKDKKKLFKKFKSAYGTRSAIIHGGDRSAWDKYLALGEFENIQELCSFLEHSFRDVIFWLEALSKDKRPYAVQYGWEDLIFK